MADRLIQNNELRPLYFPPLFSLRNADGRLAAKQEVPGTVNTLNIVIPPPKPRLPLDRRRVLVESPDRVLGHFFEGV
jgi:hypothetical protein